MDAARLGSRVGLALAVGLAAWVPASPGRAQSRPDRPSDARGAPEGLKFAHALLRDRRYDLAADQYEQFLKTNPKPADEAEARFGLGRARLFLNDFPAARREFERFLVLAPDDPNAASARFRIGEAAYLMNDLAAAREALQSYTAEHPEGIHRDTAWPELGDACFRLGDLPAAKVAYLKSLEVEPDGRLANRARYQLGKTLAALGETGEAVEVLSALGSASDPEWSGKARLQEGQILLGEGKAAEAVERFRALDSSHPPGVSATEVRVRLGEALIQSDRHDEAEAILSPLAAEGSRSVAPPAAFALAGSLLDQGKADRALAACDAAIARAPDSPWVPRLLYRSAEAVLKQGDAADARARFLRVATDHPKDAWAPSAMLRASRAALDGGDEAAASAIASKFPETFPGDPLALDARLVAARAALALDRAGDAVAALESIAADAEPGSEVAQSASYYLGLAYKANGQAEKSDARLMDLAKSPALPASADALLVLGFSRFEAKQYDEAATAFQGYLDARPKGDDAPRALAYLALAKGAAGDADAAGAALDRLAKEWPKSDALPRARLILAESALKAKRYDEAEALFRAIDEGGDPQWRPRALSGLGWAGMGAGRPEQAASAFASLIELAPEDPLAADAALGRGQALDAAGKPDEALDALALVLSQHPQSPQAPIARSIRARILGRMGKASEAADELRALIKTPPAGVSVPDLLVDLGWLLLDSGKPDEADATFRTLLDEHPDSPRADDARVFLAESLFAQGKPDEAAALLEPVAAEGSRSDPVLLQTALLRLGRIALARGDAAEAASRFDRLATAYPDGKFLLEAKFGKAEADLKAGRAAEAEPRFAEVAKQADPKLAASARVRRAQALAAMGRWDDALAEADAIQGDMTPLTAAQGADLNYVRGRALHDQARFDEARAAFQAAIDAAPGSETAAKSQFLRGETYFRQDNLNEALREFHKADLTYKNPEWQAAALLEAGKIYGKLGRWSDAADTFQKIAANFPGDARIDEVNRLLGEARKNVSAPPPPLDDAPRDRPKGE